MPRRPRILLDGLPLHIVQRGHNREPCFFTEGDYRFYFRCLGEALVETGRMLHAYALMTNHVHLLLTPGVGAQVPTLLISLGRRYVPELSYPRPGLRRCHADGHIPSSVTGAKCEPQPRGRPLRRA
ncbi:MAG TPA: transposase [Casimicrobiaceae bacterium]